MNSYEKIYYFFEVELFDECLSLCCSELKKTSHFYPWFYKAKVEYEFGEFDQAVSSFKKALVLGPDEDQIWVSLACAYELGGHRKLAWNAYVREVRLFPGNLFGWQKLAGFLTRIKRYRLAKNIFDAVDERGGIDYTISASEYAMALYWAGTLNEELAFYKKLVNMNYDDQWIYDNYYELIDEIGSRYIN